MKAQKHDAITQEELLSSDPANLYESLHSTSKQMYLERVAALAKIWGLTEFEICKAAVDLSSEHPIHPEEQQRLQSHVGYYLLDFSGLTTLAERLGQKPASVSRWRPSRHKIVLSAFSIATLLLTAGFYPLFLHKGDPLFVSLLVAPALLVISAYAVRSWIVLRLSHSLEPKVLPQLDMRGGISGRCKTLVAIPTLLLGKDHVTELVRTLETHFGAVHDPNVLFVLLTDHPDSDQEHATEGDKALMEFCVQSISELNEKSTYANCKPFFLLHRNRCFSRTEGRWMGWERKRGKIHQLLTYIASGDDPFGERVGDARRLCEAKYVIVLDEDTQIDEDAVQNLVGALAHPLNHPHIDQAKLALTRGYGILQPYIHVFGFGEGNRELPITARRVFFQDVFEACSYFGKGIINVIAYHSVIGDAIPPELVLSHDWLESALLRTGAVVSATVREPLPIGHEAMCLRRHRWIRGDWQNVRFLVSRLSGRKLPFFGKIILADLLLDSLFPVALTIVVFRGIAAAHSAFIAFVLITPSAMYLGAVWDAAISIWRGQFQKARGALYQVLMFPLSVLITIERSAHTGLMSADAICRTLYRMVSGRKLLEWRTAASTQQLKAGLNICKVYRRVETVMFSTAALSAWTLARNLPLCILLLAWALHPTGFLSRNRARKT